MDKFNTQEIQEIIDSTQAQEVPQANINQLSTGESKLVKILESYIITFELKSIRGQNVPIGAKNIKGFLKNIFGEQAMYAIYYKYGKLTLSKVKKCGAI